MFFILNEKIGNLDKVQAKVTDPYIGYKFIGNKRPKLFVEIHPQKDRIQIHLRPLEYNDPRNKITKVPDNHKWTLNKITYIYDEVDIDYVLPFIQQAYDDVCN